jgi:tRNA-dihydrouridine synthase
MRDETGCDGIMIARGSHGDPWIFKEARAALAGQPLPDPPSVEERFQICIQHARNAVAFERDPPKAMREFRKHLGWYTKGLPRGKHLRQELFQVTSLQEAEAILESYLEQHRSEPEGSEFVGAPR